jgi:hypothetical protein
MNILRRIIAFPVAILLGIALALTAPTLALAQDGAPIVVEDAGAEFVISSVWWTFIVGAVIPFVIELVTKATLNPFWKQILSILFAAVGTLVVRATQTDGTGVIDQSMLIDFLIMFATSFFTYFTTIRNTRLNGGIAPNIGIGPSTP